MRADIICEDLRCCVALIDCVSLTAVCDSDKDGQQKQLDGKVLVIRHAVDGMMMIHGNLRYPPKLPPQYIRPN